MAGLADILRSDWGSGYRDRRKEIAVEETQNLQQASGLMGLMQAAQQQQQRQQALQREQAFRGALGALPANATEDQVLAAVRPHASPDDLLKTITSSRDRQATMEATKQARKDALEARLYDIETRSQDRAATREQQAMLGKMADATRRELAEMNIEGRRELRALAGSLRQPPPAQLHTDAQGQLWERTRDGAWTRAAGPDGQPIDGRGRGPRAPMPGGATPAAPDGATAIPPTINAPKATGGSGFFGGMANTVADMVGAPMPAPEVEKATQALNNLRIQTTTLMQDAVPGRPSNYLMKELEKLAVQPGSLMMGDQRAKERLSSTRAMLAQEVARMEREVLQNPTMYTNTQLSTTRQSHGKLRQLLGEYDAALRSFGGSQSGPRTAGPVGRTGATPPPPPGFTVD